MEFHSVRHDIVNLHYFFFTKLSTTSYTLSALHCKSFRHDKFKSFFFGALYIVNLSDFVSSSQVLFTLFTLQYNVNHHDMKKSSIFFKFLPHQLQISKNFIS